MKKLYDLIENVFGMDKVAHFFGVAFVAVLVSLIFAKVDTGDTSFVYAFEGLVTGVIVAVLKEVFDFFNNRSFDIKDILAGFVGAVVSFLFVGLLL